MAAPPVKSQPLHNFSLPHLKWAHKGPSPDPSGSSSNHHRFRRRDSPDQRRHRSPDTENPSQQPHTDYPRNDGVSAAAEEEDNGDGRPWKLRRRKESVKAASTPKTVCAEKNDKKADSNCNGIKSQRLRGMIEGGHLSGGGAEKKGKRKVWISLSREEIEEDVYALTGGKPARRPKKWPKNVQKQLDNVFPGFYLAGVAADSYRAMMQWYGRAYSLFRFLNVIEVFVVCACMMLNCCCILVKGRLISVYSKDKRRCNAL